MRPDSFGLRISPAKWRLTTAAAEHQAIVWLWTKKGSDMAVVNSKKIQGSDGIKLILPPQFKRQPLPMKMKLNFRSEKEA